MSKTDDMEFNGYINRISLDGGKSYYKLKCEVVEVYPMTCPKCGGSLELHYGHGKCPFCNTNFATNFKLEEMSDGRD